MDVSVQYLQLFGQLDLNTVAFSRDHMQDTENHQQHLSNNCNYLKTLHIQIVESVSYKMHKSPIHYSKKQLCSLKSVRLTDGIEDGKLLEDLMEVFELHK